MSARRFWVFIEQEGGKVHQVSWELLGVASRLASEVKEEAAAAGDTVHVECILLGNQVEGIAREAIKYGAERVYLIDEPELENYRNCPYYKSIVGVVRKYGPEVMLIGATTLGRDLAGAVATSLRTGLTADCTGLEMGEVKGSKQRLLLATRPAFGGNIMATILCRQSRPQMSSVRPRVFPMPPYNPDAVGEIIREEVPLDEKDTEACILDFIHDQAESVDIEYADVIVSGGRGLGTPEGFKLIEELAHELGGVVGASRPCVDAGWISYAHQVGQSGRTVRPKLYIAAGISGALQHKVGMQNSDFIIAINSDPNAPIFDVADVGIVGDLFEVIPAMIKEIKARKEQARSLSKEALA
ncbi:MAG TPA: electron transfer flavoprotein subunit alpha/FixB family protein [Anaerolineae bacterium]|nr:electron transfer flavoprotein subunit alpha/FixB family protein [Anaerolineae bacterium]HQI83178.1 electron transfer flavoprotein subunit alpha/FixB family protein [Anaerolineae bacterium]